MELSQATKSNLIKKIEKSKVFAVLTDEATDISYMQQLFTFIRFYDSEKKNATDNCFVNTSLLLCESENTAPDAQLIYLSLKYLIVNDLSLNLSHFQAFYSDGASVMTGKKGGVAAKFRKDEQYENIPNIHCICHRLTLK